jgi:hypothetical protein
MRRPESGRADEVSLEPPHGDAVDDAGVGRLRRGGAPRLLGQGVGHARDGDHVCLFVAAIPVPKGVGQSGGRLPEGSVVLLADDKQDGRPPPTGDVVRPREEVEPLRDGGGLAPTTGRRIRSPGPWSRRNAAAGRPG